jgi:CheY-like chemotaxis protein
VIVELRRLLLVEDSAEDAELTLTALQEHLIANQIDWVRDGAEALEYLERRGRYAARPGGNPCVMLLDLKLPKVDGLEVLRFVKASQALATIPVVVLTSSRQDRDLAEAYRSGVNAYVVKPVDFRAFTEAVRTLGVFWAIINEPPLAVPGSPPVK